MITVPESSSMDHKHSCIDLKRVESRDQFSMVVTKHGIEKITDVVSHASVFYTTEGG